MASIVEVKLELGHRAKVREFPSEEGHTHDWVIFVKGSDGIKLEHFVEKVVFWLHESYDPNRRVIKHPPYKVEQSGFAGFNMLIDVHFRNREDPKMVRFQYDLFLHTKAMPPVNHTRLEKLTFTNPTEDFRKKLINAGATLITPQSNSRHTSKDRSGRSPISKKDRSKSKDASKHREGSASSTSRSQEDRKRSSSAHSGKKDGRIPGKDMKKHEDAFKHPKVPDLTRTHKDSEGSEKGDQERGRSEKRRSIADNEGNRKKKKKRSEDHTSPSQNRPKTLNLSSGSTAPIPQKKEKEKVRKIREKPDLMAGLFAPESSINMTQIKQKEKGKLEHSESKIKKERSTPNETPSRISPHPNQEEKTIIHSSKISPGNLTLKIKKERITSAEKDKENPNKIHKAKKESDRKEKKHSKESMKDSTSLKVKMQEKKAEPKRTPTMSSTSSSSSGSDMDISDSEYSSDDSNRAKVKTTAVNASTKVEDKIKSRSKQVTHIKESPKGGERRENRALNVSSDGKVESKSKSERNSFRSSPNSSKLSEKVGKDSFSHSEKSFSKLKKSSKNKTSDVEKKDINISLHKQKKHKQPSKEKSTKRPSKEKRQATPSAKEERFSSTPNIEQASIKKEKHFESSSSFLSRTSPSTNTKVRKSSTSSRSSGRPSKEKEKSLHRERPSDSKSSVSTSGKKETPKRTALKEEKPKPVYKSRSFVETSSDDSDDDRPISNETTMKTSHVRKDSPSSYSSASSPDNPGPPPVHSDRESSPSSSSASSDDEDIVMNSFPPNTSTLSVISPIRDCSNSYENTVDATTAYQDMQMSDSSEESPEHPPLGDNPSQENVFDPLCEEDEEDKSPQSLGIGDDYTSSSDEDSASPPEKPFQHDVEEDPENANQDTQESSPSSQQEDMANVIIFSGSEGNYPHMTDSLYRKLQDLQRKISFVTDIDRLRKIARIVAKSQKLLKNDDYFDFDLCSLDHRTIHKIQKQLEAA